MHSSRRSSRTSRSDDERGFVLVWFALLIILLLTVAAFAVDLGHAYYVAQKAQDAADAAALSAATYLPDNCANADPHAVSISALNGFPNSGASTVSAVNGSKGTGCDNDQTLRPNEIQVNVKAKVDTLFARVIGIDTLSVSRSSTAEFDPPVQLGSPSSFFGNAPGCVLCDQPDIWASVAGEANRKQDGNAIFGDYCANSTADNCSGNGLSSTDRDTNGMLFEISNPLQQPLNIELYDPGYIGASNPPGSYSTCADPTNSVYPTCAGDSTVQVLGSPPPTTTTYTLYPLDNLAKPLGSPKLCQVTYPGYNSYVAAAGAGLADLSFRSYHAWANLASDAGCPALQSSSYVLQVQSGDDISGPAQGGINNFSVAACTGCASTQPQSDPNVDVSAITKMSLFTNATTANPKFYLARVPSWARGQFLRLNFFDVGDISNAAGQAIGGALSVTAVDATHGAGGPLVGEFSNCTYSHPGNPDRSTISGPPSPWDPGSTDIDWASNPNSLVSMGGGCTAQVNLNAAGNGATWNGKWVTWRIPIPTDYTCDDRDLTQCWLRIQYNYGANAQFHDATTWTASLTGNPVRLTK